MPPALRLRYDHESRKHGELWRKLFEDARYAGDLRADLHPTVARMLVMGALSLTAEWWNPRRESLETVIKTAQSLVRSGLAELSAAADEATAKPPSPSRRRHKAPGTAA
ncbi:hypothetical protein [Streptomyces sp. NPDC058335]|uniref:hypothetical protein n=1 Tax=Streptomyces sp. NPDC058335 TaxID=3346451 RepID=UPI0036587848